MIESFAIILFMSEEILYGFPERPGTIPKGFNVDPDWLKEQKVKGRTDADIGAQLGVSASTIYNTRLAYGIRITCNRGKKRRGKAIDPAWLREQKSLGRSDAQIAETLGVSVSSIAYARKVNGIEPGSKHGQNMISIDLPWLKEQKRLGRSDADIAAELGVCRYTVLKRRKFYEGGINPDNR